MENPIEMDDLGVPLFSESNKNRSGFITGSLHFGSGMVARKLERAREEGLFILGSDVAWRANRSHQCMRSTGNERRC